MFVFPAKIRKKDSLFLSFEAEDFKASDGWSLSFILSKNLKRILIETTTEGGAFLVNEPEFGNSETEAGVYVVHAILVKRENEEVQERQTVFVGSVDVLEDLTQQGKDTRSWAERALDNVKAVLSNTANHAQKSYAIQGRSIDHFSWKELMELKAWLEKEVNTEKAKNSKKSANKIYVNLKK